MRAFSLGTKCLTHLTSSYNITTNPNSAILLINKGYLFFGKANVGKLLDLLDVLG
jgi:hypothetical protein